MPPKTRNGHAVLDCVKPLIGQRGKEIQPYGTSAHWPIALADRVCQESVSALNQILADTVKLRDMYKKHHWQVTGPTFYQLHLLFDKHCKEPDELIDEIASASSCLAV